MAEPGRRVPIQERLEQARTPEEVARILGKPRLAAYAVVFLGGAVACLAGIAVMASKIALHQASAWILLVLPAPLFLLLFCGLLGYGGAYYLVTGRRWPKAEKIDKFIGRLETNV